MYRFFYLMIIIAISASTVKAQHEVLEVGSTPAAIIYGGNDLFHVFCYGIDENFNGIVDEGDEPSSWWTIHVPMEGEPSSLKRMDFDTYFSTFNLKPGYDAVSGAVFIPFNDQSVAAYNVNAFQLTNQEVVTGKNVNAISTTPGGSHLFLSVRTGGFDEEGVVEVFAVSSQNVIQTIPAGVMPTNTFQYAGDGNKQGFAILNEGSFGAGNSSIMVGEFAHMQQPDFTTIELGDTGNHAFMDGDNIYICVNGSDKLEVVNVKDKAIIHTIETETSEGNGPRQSVINQNMLYVSTFDGNIKVYDKNSYELIRTIDLGNKTDAIAAGSNKIVAAMPYEGQSFTANNQVALLDLITSVNEETDQQVKVFPNPASNSFTVDTRIGSSVRITDVTGRILYENDNTNSSLTINAARHNMSQGVYYIEIMSENEAKTIPLIINK